MQLYYSPFWSKDEPFFLSEEESRHAISVMRHRQGDILTVIDGKGNKISTEITIDNPKKTQLRFIKSEFCHQEPNTLHMAISPTKSNDRIEWFIEKACEIGVGQITPVLFHRTERAKINIERWNKIAIAACKQAQILYFPIIKEAIKFESFIKSSPKTPMVASIGATKKLSSEIKTEEATILIGPEGDFTSDELTQMRHLNWKEISLSENILRVETAGLVAVSQWNSL